MQALQFPQVLFRALTNGYVDEKMKSYVAAESGAMTVRLHLWLENDSGMAFGPGRLVLLEAIEKTGSLQAAAKSLGMSYRAAWGKIKTSEELLGEQLIEKRGGNRSGYCLTEFGELLRREYHEWLDQVEDMANRLADERFPFATKTYAESRRSNLKEMQEEFV